MPPDNWARRAEPSPSYRFFEDDRRDGTLAPFSRASLKPIAIACFRLFTLPPDPLLSVPFFRRRIADLTRFDADFPYLAMSHLTWRWCTDRSRDVIGESVNSTPHLRFPKNQRFGSWDWSWAFVRR
jgi:hypothetical protein